MRKNDYTKFVIMSSYNDKLSHDMNKHNKQYFKEVLKINNFKYTSGIGKHKDTLEDIEMILIKDEGQLFFLKDLALNYFDQESILYQDNDGFSYIIDGTGKRLNKGQMIEVNESCAYMNDYFTFINNKYYICK